MSVGGWSGLMEWVCGGLWVVGVRCEEVKVWVEVKGGRLCINEGIWRMGLVLWLLVVVLYGTVRHVFL